MKIIVNTKKLKEALKLVGNSVATNNSLPILDGVYVEVIDETIKLPKPEKGYLHPTTETIRAMNDFFKYYGFSVVEGPEIETEEYNFRGNNQDRERGNRAMRGHWTFSDNVT